jgi:hypothetical protein
MTQRQILLNNQRHVRKMTETIPEVELSTAEFIALAERDREAAINLMWPDAENRAAMKLLDAAAFDGYIEFLKAQLEGQANDSND